MTDKLAEVVLEYVGSSQSLIGRLSKRAYSVDRGRLEALGSKLEKAGLCKQADFVGKALESPEPLVECLEKAALATVRPPSFSMGSPDESRANRTPSLTAERESDRALLARLRL